MRVERVNTNNKKCLMSVLLVFVLVATSIVVIFPLTAPKAEAVVHLASADLEDGNPLYDWDGVPFPNGYVLWDQMDDHIISDPTGYIIPPGYTLDIPALNYNGNPMTYSVNIQSGLNILVDGTLITNSDGNPGTRTAFLSGGSGDWDGIHFGPTGRGCFVDVLVEGAQNGIVFGPGSELISPGIRSSTFRSTGGTAIIMDGALGYTNIIQPLGDNTLINASNGIGLEVSNGFLNISNDVYFENHGSGLSSLHIVDATVSIDSALFLDQDVPGNAIHIEGEGSNDTLIDICSFQNGEPGHHFIRADGSSPLIRNCTFQGLSPSGPLSVIANDFFGHSAHPILRNPNPPGTTFDNSTLNATGSSSVSLQWYKDVYVEDPNGNPIVNSPVRIKDRLGNPAQPPMKLTDSSGWVKGFIVTELTQYNTTRVVLNPFNVSAENNTVYGYVYPEETISQSMTNSITVPFRPAPPQPSPSPPVGLQAKLVGSITHVMLSWNASADDGKGENDVEGYTVYKSSTGVNGTYDFKAWINATGSASYNWTDLNAGDGDWNDYFYIVRANDTLNIEEKNNNKVGKFVNYCENGWNLISLPLIQINTSRESALYAMDGNYVSIQGYHAGKSRPWLHWHRGKPHYFNDPIDINHIQGYYIDMQIPDYLVVAGKVPSNIQISLKNGWNLMNYPYLINKTVSDALSSITGKYNAVLFYDTVKDREVKLGLNDYMKPGLGYWIHATENCVWEI